MYNFIENLCKKLCYNLFNESPQNCSNHIKFKEKLLFLFKPSTELKVKINRQINQFCHVHKNRFWIIYYRLTENKIDFSCKKCHKHTLCQAYILKRIIKHIKSFNSNQESVVFQAVRERLKKCSLSSTLDKESQEVITHYESKIHKLYREKIFAIHTGTALVENILSKMEKTSLQQKIEERLQRYKLYASPFVLQTLFEEESPHKENKELLEKSLLELLEREKFLNYIKTPIESRYIDFVRSKSYTQENELHEEVECSEEESNSSLEEEEIAELLKVLSNEQKMLYKLRYGFRLDNREFLTISYKFKELQKELMECFNSTEKLYIKFSIHYALEKDSKHFDILGDIREIQTNISKKLLNYREKLLAQSYREGKEEIVLKLVYNEALSAKELSSLFGMTDKQIHKKIENIKKKLKR